MRNCNLSRTAAVLLSAALALTGGYTSLAFGQGNQQQEDGPPKQITLTQQQIDGLVAAQKEIQPLEEKMNSDKPDPAVQAKLADIVKKNGFADLPEYGSASYSVGIVLAGVDPETKSYVGPAAVLKKQIAEVKADAKMPAKEKKEALAELNEALKSTGSDKPMDGNVDLVTKNFEKLTAGAQQDSK